MSYSPSHDVVICGLGAVTPVGRDALSSAAAVRAALSGFTQHPLMADTEGRPVHVAACPWLTESASTASRLGDCLVEALRDALRALARDGGVDSNEPCALFVNLPLVRPGIPDDIVEIVRRRVQQSLPRQFQSVALAQRGHAGGLLALRSAVKVLTAGTVRACVVAGADSYMDLETLEWLEDTEQLHGAGRRNHAWGFVPGEGAGAILLMLRSTAERLGIEPLGRIVSVGVGTERNLIRTGSVCLGIGLTGAFSEALAALADGLRVTDTYCDMNGEPYRADEYGFAVLRTRDHFVSASEFVAPADCWGDVGAASAPLFLVLAVVAFNKAYALGDVSLVWASSDTGERGAALVVGA